MDIIKDDAAQTSAEMLLLFGGVIVIVVAAALFYRNYLAGLGNAITGTDLQNTISGINNLTGKFT
ncbi:MAG TPA: class III signal peptide-containing protein [Methanobacterium sp.]